jgi:hypothetical protein
VLGGPPGEFAAGVLPKVGAGHGPVRRAGLVLRMLRRGKERVREGVRAHCELGGAELDPGTILHLQALGDFLDTDYVWDRLCWLQPRSNRQLPRFARFDRFPADRQQKVKFTSPDNVQFMGDWYVWQMAYPGGKTTNVHVSYDQILNYRGSHGYVFTDYVLRTGALWDGTIGDATVAMSSSTGGTFLSADKATSVSPSQVAWHLTDVKPEFDPSAV